MVSKTTVVRDVAGRQLVAMQVLRVTLHRLGILSAPCLQDAMQAESGKILSGLQMAVTSPWVSGLKTGVLQQTEV